MKHNALIIAAFLIILCSCSQITDKNIDNNLNANKGQSEKAIISDSMIAEELDKIRSFSYAKSFPVIKDTVAFMNELREAFGLEDTHSKEQPTKEQILCYKKFKIFGSAKELILIEYSFGDGPSVLYPYKFQLLLNTEGELIKILDGVRWEKLKVSQNQLPFLLVVHSTAKGNGGHGLYRMKNDSLENILDRVGYFPRTYDAHHDHNLNQPAELRLKILDKNNDGFNDLVFSGKIIRNTLGNSVDEDKKNNVSISIKLIFIFDETSGHFKEFEDYSEKYSEYDRL